MLILEERNGRHDSAIFDGFHVIAAPLAEHEARAGGFPSSDGGPGVTYGAYQLRLAIRESGGRDMFILLTHGGGSFVYSIHGTADQGALRAAILAMPEREQFSLLYMLYRAADDSAKAARDNEGRLWRQAHIGKRIRQRTFRSKGIAKVWIEPEREEGESDSSYDMRKKFAAP